MNGAYWDESIPTYPLLLEQAGYYIGYTYKVWSPGKSKNAPYGGNRTRYESAGIEFNNFSHAASRNAKSIGVEEAKQALLEETRNNYRSFRESVPDDSPFCYWWGPTNTHRTWEKGSGKNLWGLDPDELKERLPNFLPDVKEIREDFNDYLGECMAFDAGLGVLLEELAAANELDNTFLVVSGDHGIPGFPRAKCNLYDLGCQVAMAARWPGNIPPSTEVEGFVNLMSLASTFMEAADVTSPAEMAPSLLELMKGVDAGSSEWDHVVTGRERHVSSARENYLPYPQRAIRTEDYLYIRNFAHERWPMGDPKGTDDITCDAPDEELMLTDTRAIFPDVDASPTKAWIVSNRAVKSVTPLFTLGFGKRPEEELYDLKNDPNYMVNVAYKEGFEETRENLSGKLMQILISNKDPRVLDKHCRFDLPPYAGPVPEDWWNWSE